MMTDAGTLALVALLLPALVVPGPCARGAAAAARAAGGLVLDPVRRRRRSARRSLAWQRHAGGRVSRLVWDWLPSQRTAARRPSACSPTPTRRSCSAGRARGAASCRSTRSATCTTSRQPALGRYYTYQSLFAFSMMGLVLAPNLLQLFICWELVGLCSYLLIGFWYQQARSGARGGQGVLDHEGRRRRPADRHRAALAACRDVRPRPSCARWSTSGALPLAGLSIITFCIYLGADGQVGAVPAARLAARRDGRPDAGLGADSRRDDGDGGRVPAARARRGCSR